MEEKVHVVLKLLEEEGDSFAKRAEMYYKRRPELISFVEESFRAYRSLADRYDHISTELQNANNTIASVCPDQVPYMDEDDEDSPRPKTPRKMGDGYKPNVPSVPKVPKPPLRDFKTVITTATKKLNTKKAAAAAAAPKVSKVPKSGLSRKAALQEMDKLQKEILALQTVKEFVKSTYDNAIAKYWDTENQIKALQEKVSSLQDELGEGIAIDDEEARCLMAAAALKSCQDTLSNLEVKQSISLNEAKVESKRVKEVRDKLSSIMNECNYDQTTSKGPRAKRDVKEIVGTMGLDEEVEKLNQQKQEMQVLQEKIKEHFEAGSYSTLTVQDMAEKIDSLVNKVVSLETAVSSQTALVQRLKVETDELNSVVRTLESDKESLINDKAKLNEQLREMNDKLRGVQDLNQIVSDQNSNLRTHFTEAHCNLDQISEKVQKGKPDVVSEISQPERNSSTEAESEHGLKGQDALNQDSELLNDEKSNTANQATAGVDDTATSDKELKVAEVVKDNVIHTVNSDKELEGAEVLEDSVSHTVNSDKELKVAEAEEVKDGVIHTGNSDKELKVAEGVKDSVIHTVNSDEDFKDAEGEEDSETVNTDEEFKDPDDKPKVTSSQENDVKVTNSVEMEEEKPGEDKSQRELKEREKSPDSSHSDIAKSTDALKTTAENQVIQGHHSQEQKISKEDEPDWQEMLNGMRDREQALLSEYSNALQNYDEMKTKLAEIEKKNQDALFESSLQLKELKTANALKDEEIRLLRQKLGVLQKGLDGKEDLVDLTSVQPVLEKNDIEEYLKAAEPDTTISAIEEKFRMSIDELLEENLDFWLKFSTSFTGIQKFETTIKDLLIEVSRIEDKWKSSEGSSSAKYSLKTDAKPLYKHLAEILNELSVWLENSALLKEELQCRFTSLCEIQEEITAALKASAEDDDFKFTSYQAAKFQGEVLNMKQENNKVADELQAGLDLVTTLQLDGEKALAKMNEKFGLSSSKKAQRTPDSNSVPLRSFIFGVKPKKQKQSIFSCMTPGMNRKYRAYKG
ncbi:protein NETWORKED 2D-like isoform X2 [Vigna unguiculata]|nr:protein NETWORKED 2D-like isoform X2 [Vigna unguiculata]